MNHVLLLMALFLFEKQ